VIDDRIWLTSSERVAISDDEAKKALSKYPYDRDDFQAHAAVQLFLIELDTTQGRILRRIDLFKVDRPPPIHASNSYASPTPVSDGEHIYCHFGALGTACVSIADAKVVWKRTITIEEITGGGGSPALANGTLCIACDGANEQFVIGLNKLTGETSWQTARPPIPTDDPSRKRAFSTPLVVNYQGRTQLISVGAQWLVSYDPSNGKEWWRAKIGTGHACVPMPVYSDGVVYACTGYPKAQLVAVRVDGSGDVTPSHVLWTINRQVPEITSPLLVNQELYFVSSMGVLSCVDCKTGDSIWQHRLPGNFAASPLFADGRIYITSKEGVTTVLQAGRQFTEIAKNELFGPTLASLAVFEHKLLIRTDPILHCIEPAKQR
jgi:outer membrane protein assembly factor BamB